jgi:hypothetical protein
MATIGSGSARIRQPWLAVLALGGLALAMPVEATTALGLTTDNSIVAFDTNAPGSPFGGVVITGLQPGEGALAIDLRPATGQIYVLGSSSRLYVVNLVTGAATAVGPPFTPTLSGTRFGFDFNPSVDRIRLVSDTGQNLRLDPDTGAVVAVDTNLNPGAPHIVEVAYANNASGAATTTLYAIDAATDQLFIQSPPNGGTLGLVGALGVDTSDLVGFDIAANENAAYATLSTVNTSLYRIDLATGAATVVGTVGGSPYLGLTLVARSVPLIALRNGAELVRFHSATPGTVFSVTPITGLQPGETLVGIDFLPSNGLVYGVGSTSRLYTVDPMSGGATAVGPPFSPLLAGAKFGVDVNLQDASLRVVSDTGQTLRLNLNTGASTGGGFPFTPAVAEIAYNRGANGLPSGQAYGIDIVNDRLLFENFLPGPSQVVGPLGVDATSAVGFDASPLDDRGIAILTVGGVPSLYAIDLRTGAATLIGAVGGGGTITGLTAVPTTLSFAEGSTGSFFDTDLLLANPGPAPVPVVITYLTDTARVLTHSFTLPATSRTTVSADANTRLGSTAFSSTISSPTGAPIVAERTMRWDASGYGMHTDHAVTSLSARWYFAEGAQGFYQTYFLLANPLPVDNTASVSFLMENGTVVQRSYPIPAQARLTVYAGSIPELVNHSFGTSVLFVNAPGAVERAMYFGSPVFNGGHESAGVTQPATEWFLAEGATGSFFTTFVLLANPSGPDANVTLTYLREGGGTVTRTMVLPASSRRTINVALEDASLAATSVATRITSDVPIVAERSMYWPFDPASWQEAHNAFGVTGTGRRWGLAEGRVGGPFAFQTFVLVANPGTIPANLTVTFLRTTGGTITKTLSIAPAGRLTITTGPGSMVPELADEEFGVVIASDQPVFAEQALYSNANNVFWAAGSAATATALP